MHPAAVKRMSWYLDFNAHLTQSTDNVFDIPSRNTICVVISQLRRIREPGFSAHVFDPGNDVTFFLQLMDYFSCSLALVFIADLDVDAGRDFLFATRFDRRSFQRFVRPVAAARDLKAAPG
jgi:hypothetical protein